MGLEYLWKVLIPIRDALLSLSLEGFLVSGNLHVNCALGCELVITVHLCKIFMCVCSVALVQMAAVFFTISQTSVFNYYSILCLSLQDVAYKPEEQFVETRKCEPDAGGDVVGACERYGISRFLFILVFFFQLLPRCIQKSKTTYSLE